MRGRLQCFQRIRVQCLVYGVRQPRPYAGYGEKEFFGFRGAAQACKLAPGTRHQHLRDRSGDARANVRQRLQFRASARIKNPAYRPLEARQRIRRLAIGSDAKGIGPLRLQ